MNLSILIPTLNRPEMLAILLRYYHSTYWAAHIFIGDSSTPEIFALNAKECEKYAWRNVKYPVGPLNITHVAMPGVNDSMAIKKLADLVKTHYVVYTGDDDVLVLDKTQDCITFLNKHEEYVACGGDAMTFAMEDGKLRGCAMYELPSIEQEYPDERVMHQARDYRVSLFAIHRTNVFRWMYRNIDTIKDKSFTEIMPCFESAFQGKTKRLPGLYLLRQMHNRRYILPRLTRWMASENFRQSFEVMELVFGAQAMMVYFKESFHHALAKPNKYLDARTYINYVKKSFCSRHPAFLKLLEAIQ